MPKRIYDFDELEKISELLDLNLRYIGGGSYIDLEPDKDEIDCDVYLGWDIVKMLDRLPEDVVKDIICKEGE